MMFVKLLPNGNKLVPTASTIEIGGVVIDSHGVREVPPEDPEYDGWNVITIDRSKSRPRTKATDPLDDGSEE